MIKNAMRITAAFIALFFSTQLLAKEADTKTEGNPLFTQADWGLGVYYASHSNSVMPVLSVSHNWFTGAFGMNVTHNRDTGSGSNFNYLFDVGFRVPVQNTFNFTLGASFQYENTSKSTAGKDPYVFGPYLGFSYNLSKTFLLEATILPYGYERSTTDVNTDTFFQHGRLGVSYLF